MTLELIGTIVSAALAAGVGLYAAVSTRRATRRTNEIEQQQTAIGGYQKLVADLRADLDRVRGEHAALRLRVDDLERGQRADHDYIRVLVSAIRDGGLSVPIRANNSGGTP